MKKRILFGMILILSFNSAVGQDKQRFLLSTGYGENEFLNISLGYLFSHASIAVSAGFQPVSYISRDIAIGITSNFYISGNSKLSEVKPFYLKYGVQFYSFSYDGSLESKRNELTALVRMGRNFNLSPSFAIYLEGGFFGYLIEDEGFECIGCEDDEGNGLSPGFGIGMLYRL